MSDPVSYHSKLAESWSSRYSQPEFRSRIQIFVGESTGKVDSTMISCLPRNRSIQPLAMGLRASAIKQIFIVEMCDLNVRLEKIYHAGERDWWLQSGQQLSSRSIIDHACQIRRITKLGGDTNGLSSLSAEFLAWLCALRPIAFLLRLQSSPVPPHSSLGALAAELPTFYWTGLPACGSPAPVDPVLA